MRNCGANDFFEVRQRGSFASVDPQAMADLYLPLIGSHAFAVYFALWGEEKTPSTHDHLFRRLQLSPGQFYQAMLPLEAMGLVETFYQEENGIAYFLYCLRTPVDPASFFSDVLYSGMLRQYVGEAQAKKLEEKYVPDESPIPSSFAPVSQSFKAFYSPDLTNPLFRASEKKAVESQAKVKTDFDYRAFANTLSGLGVRPESLSEEEVRKIDRLSCLNCLSSDLMGQLAADCYQGYRKKGQRVDFLSLEKRCRDSLSFSYLREQPQESKISSDSEYANLIRTMEKLAPATFLTYLQKRHKPSSSDLKLLAHLANDLGLTDPAINALVWYTLQKNGNELPYGFADKVGASLVRQNCLTARDAWESLLSSQEKKRAYKAKETPQNASPLETDSTQKKGESSEKDADEALDRLAKFLGKK